MADLKVTNAELDAVAARLGDAAVATLQPVCLATGGIGSGIVEAAFGEVDSLVIEVARALATAAQAAGTATANAIAVLDAQDAELAGANK